MASALITSAVLLVIMILRWIVFPPDLFRSYETRMKRLMEMKDNGEISEENFQKAKEYYDKHPNGTYRGW